MYTYRATEKHKWVRAVKSKPKTLRHFKVNPVLKIYETVYKQAESMCVHDHVRFKIELSLRHNEKDIVSFLWLQEINSVNLCLVSLMRY